MIEPIWPGSEECYRIWGIDPRQGLPNREIVCQRIHPDDRDRVHDEAQEALRQKRDYTIEFQNRTTRWNSQISS